MLESMLSIIARRVGDDCVPLGGGALGMKVGLLVSNPVSHSRMCCKRVRLVGGSLLLEDI